MCRDAGAAAALSLYWLCYHRPLPFEDPDRVVVISGVSLGQHAETASHVDALPAFEAIAVYRAGFRRLVASSGSASGMVAAVSPGFFQVLGIAAGSGRLIDGSDGSTSVVVLSDDVVPMLCGTLADEARCVIRIGGMPHDVIGRIASEPFPAPTIAWVPYSSQIVATEGAFGVAVYSAANRLHECAVRADCGATRPRLMVWLAAPAARVCIFGAAVGLLLSNGTEGLLRHLVYSPNGLAPLMRVGVALTVAGVMITATLSALAQAFRDDPVRYLREQ